MSDSTLRQIAQLNKLSFSELQARWRSPSAPTRASRRVAARSRCIRARCAKWWRYGTDAATRRGAVNPYLGQRASTGSIGGKGA